MSRNPSSLDFPNECHTIRIYWFMSKNVSTSRKAEVDYSAKLLSAIVGLPFQDQGTVDDCYIRSELSAIRH
jgi:hypothetical protein